MNRKRKKIQEDFMKKHDRLFEDLGNEKKEDLSQYARRISLNLSTDNDILELQENIKDDVCVCCKKKHIPYTSKKGFTYNSNPDKSVHAVFLNDAGELICSKNRVEFGDFKARFQQSRESTKEQPKEEPKSTLEQYSENVDQSWVKKEIPRLKFLIESVGKEFPKWTTLDVRITAGMMYNNLKLDERSYAKT